VLNLGMLICFQLNEEDQPALLDFLEFQPYFFLRDINSLSSCLVTNLITMLLCKQMGKIATKREG